MRPTIFLFMLLAALFISNTSNAQTWVLKGKVVSKADNKELPGVTIKIKNTEKGTITDLDGKYEIVLSDSCIVVYSFIGFTTQTKRIKKGQIVQDVVLEVNTSKLEEVVVVGYGVKKKADVTGSISSVRSVDYAPVVVKESKAREVVMVEDVESGESPTKLVSSSPNSEIKSGMLTAGEVNDFSKWTLWNDMKTDELKLHQKTWKINPKHRFSFQLTDKNDLPAIDQVVELLKDDKVIWTTRTDNTGKAEFWDHLYDLESSPNSKYTIRTQCDGKSYEVSKAKSFVKGMNHQKVKAKLKFPDQADIVFVVDATGSMEDEINYLKVEMNDVMAKVKANHPEIKLNLGSVVYRDKGDEYITRTSELNGDISKTVEFIKQQAAEGGGDFPEAVDSAMNVAVNHLKWSTEARARLLFLVLDAPPHDDPETIAKMQKLAMQAAAKGIKIIPVACSGTDKSTEYLMRALALAANGTYTFLTDDSGIGDSHIKPTTDKWEVEHLNELMIRLINQYLYVPTLKNEAIAQDSTINEKIIAQQNNGVLPADSAQVDHPDLKPNDLVFDFKMYPNPTNGILHIEISQELTELFLADLSGKILEKYTPSHQQQITLDLTNYPNGLYFVKYPFKGKWRAGKVLLMR